MKPAVRVGDYIYYALDGKLRRIYAPIRGKG